MPVENYGVLKGKPLAGQVEAGKSPHYRISVNAGTEMFTVAVNIQSTDGSEVLYCIESAFTPPGAAALLALNPGITALTSTAGGLALDYVREQVQGRPMVQRSQMSLLPEPPQPGSSQLNDAIIALVQQAIAGDAELYAFGSAYADGGVTDGIHNIHMNQGNPAGGFAKDNGSWQDGGLFLYMPATQTWSAVFLAFQTESWTTDEAGNPLPQ